MTLFTRRRLVGAAVFVLAGCATEGAIRETMDMIVGSWFDATKQEVLAQWGQPQSTKPGLRGQEFEWVTESSGQTSGTAYTMTTRAPFGSGSDSTTIYNPPRTYYSACIRRLTFDGRDRVIAYDWEGNACCFAAIAGRCASWVNQKKRG